MWFQKLKRKRCATSPDSRVINQGFLRVAVIPDPDIAKIGIDNIRCQKENRQIWIFTDMLDESMGHGRQ